MDSDLYRLMFRLIVIGTVSLGVLVGLALGLALGGI